MAFLQITGLTKSFDGAAVLRGVDISLEKGQTLAVIGSSGGGKTTLLRCIASLERADAGTITLGGDTLFDGNAFARVAVVAVRARL